jgi:uncharacterized protein
MSKKDQFLTQFTEGYQFQGDYIELGGAMLDGEVLSGHKVMIPLKTMNRHGLIAGLRVRVKPKLYRHSPSNCHQKERPFC